MAKKRIRLKDVERLGHLQCQPREAAGFLGIRVATFRELLRTDPAVKEAWENGREMGKISLRRKQMNLASSNATMAIFLGKQYLGQRDVVTTEHTGLEGLPLDLSTLSKEDRDELRAIVTRATRSGSSSEGAGSG